MSDINNSNENYIKEMEKNARLFEEKMNKLEQIRSNNLKNNYNKPKIIKQQFNSNNKFEKNDYSKIKDNFSNDIETNSYNNYQKNNINNENYLDNNNYEIYNNKRNTNNYEFQNNIQNNSERNEIIKYKNKLEQIKNEIVDKDKIIKQLEKSLKEKENLPSQHQYEEINNNCEKLKIEVDEKIKFIKRKENENKELKMKIDNLVEQIKNMKEVIKRKNDEIENMKMNIDSLKEEISINIQKINNLDLQNKKLNIDYENLNKDFYLIKNEKEKMNHEMEELKAKIFNYQKELSQNLTKKNIKSNDKFDYDNYNYLNINKIYDFKSEKLKDNLVAVNDDNDFNERKLQKRNNYPSDFLSEEKYKEENSKYSYIGENNNIINKSGGLKKKNYSNYDLEKFPSAKKPIISSLSDLESRLSYLISEKKKLENELLKMPEHPRNLNEIKIKKELNNKITDTEQEINSIRTKIRNYEY